MPSHQSPAATCEVFTFKEGMLSAIAHDLRLTVESLSVEIGDDEAIVARLDARSLRVDCAMKQGRESRGSLDAKQRREIEANLADKVLHSKRHPEIVFRSRRVEGEGDQRRIEGTLSLHGVDRPLRVQARREGGRWTAEVPLHQPDFGIKPFSAMLGTLKIQPQVRVRISVPA